MHAVLQYCGPACDVVCPGRQHGVQEGNSVSRKATLYLGMQHVPRNVSHNAKLCHLVGGTGSLQLDR